MDLPVNPPVKPMLAKAVDVVLIGNINGPHTLYEGTTDDVKREVFYALDAGVDIIAREEIALVIKEHFIKINIGVIERNF